jgi:hypothetical protein
MSDTAAAKAGYPPLPDNAYVTPAAKPLLADGCYFLAFGLFEVANSVGTIRVRTEDGKLFVSGDLYQHDPGPDDPPIGQIPPPGARVPVFPIADYRFYLRFTKVEAADGGGLALTFEVHQFVAKAPAPFDGSNASHWRFERTCTARLNPAAAPAGYPKTDMFFSGDVLRDDETSSPIGLMQIGWISDVLRRAVIKIDRVKGSEAPEDNGAGVTWKSVFDPIGWDVSTIVGPDTVTKEGDNTWAQADARVAFARLKEGGTLDTEWRYHILVVPLMEQGDTDFGFMYVRGDEHDEHARTDLFMASHFIFPDDKPEYAPLRGQRNGKTVVFLRTALHEMGHEMGLEHNQTGFCFMRPTAEIARAGTTDAPFPGNITWSYDPDDAHRLRHWPDISVRPGGIDIGSRPDRVA